jgi:hypothetical protein
MVGLFHDTLFGQLLRLLSPGHFMQYPDEKDPTILQRYVSTNTDRNPTDLQSKKSHEVYPNYATYISAAFLFSSNAIRALIPLVDKASHPSRAFLQASQLVLCLRPALFLRFNCS